MVILPVGSIISGDAGHNCSPDVGAVGYRKEDDLTKEVWLLVKSKLKSAKYTVVDCTPYGVKFNSVNGSLAYRVKIANSSGSKFHLCIHFNVYNGTANGVESWISGLGGLAEVIGKSLCNEIEKLGFVNRGVKVGKLYVPLYTNMPCVLLECCFCDSKVDMSIYEKNKMADAIVGALVGFTIPSTPTTPEKPDVDITPPENTEIVANAKVVNDWFYVRDAVGNIIDGRIDIGDGIEVLDISYSKQLVLVKYPTPNGTRTEYIKNVPSLIKYLYAYQYENGSTSETIYQDSTCTQIIGYLNPHEKATPLYRRNGILHVAYDTTLGKHTKSGYVKYKGNFTKF
ncbi:N-acetylmuramoyl-L-alanine amidase [Clostridium sp. MSJ-4]|uniref:N-acetylmuramoyl-L-alanine amidase n=1 Tax=Clostridium simiarum TaxID=2841506 RepID=A0ABS6EZM2_9CLOT|nr:N-acetylmuramoyl-L-alanine amidase [Clostridium simiarum]MBU5591155.1 N-acetylmuramoyl-L-alanine amidase [Clostridium simiarum]